MDEKISWWRITFYLSLLTMTVWLILKVTGVINTPVWLEYGVPLGSLIVAGLTFSQELFKEVRVIGTDVITLKVDVGSLKSDVSILKTDVGILKTDVAVLKTRTDHIEKKLYQ